MKKIILVTGSAGFIGFHVCQHLLAEGYRVVGIDNLNQYYDPSLKKNRNAILKKYPDYKFYKVDIANIKDLEKVFRENSIQQICHLAAQAGVRYSLQNPFVYLRSNVDGTLNVFELAKKYAIKEIVFSSSSSVYGNLSESPFKETGKVDQPVSLYAATKAADELIAHVYQHLYQIKVIGLRFFTVYGPWGRPDMALFNFVDKILKNKTIELFNYGKMQRDFTYIADITAGILSALEKVSKTAFEIINLGNSEPVKITRVIAILEKLIGRKAKIKYLPMQPGDVYATYADIHKAGKMLNYKPATELEKGIESFLDWYKSYYLLS